MHDYYLSHQIMTPFTAVKVINDATRLPQKFGSLQLVHLTNGFRPYAVLHAKRLACVSGKGARQFAM